MGCCVWYAMCSTSKAGLSLMRKVMSFGLSSIRRHRSCVGSVPPYRGYSHPHILPLIWAKLRYLERLATGVWQPALAVAEQTPYRALAIGADGSVHIIWQR